MGTPTNGKPKSAVDAATKPARSNGESRVRKPRVAEGKNGSSNGSSTGNGKSEPKQRTTVFISRVLDANWRAVAFIRNQSKTEVFEHALIDVIKKEDLDPTQEPIIQVLSPS